MSVKNIIYIRGENNNDEYRNVLIPEHVKILIELGGFVIYVEKSHNRVYSDNEYEKCGAILTDLKWYDSQFKDALIIGLKGVKDVELPKLRQHRHVFFSHSYERQVNSNTILHEFCKSRSRIYDFEYFVDNNNKRLLSFGYHAGVVGGLLGILQYIQRKKYNTCIKDLKYWDSIETVIKDNNELQDFKNIIFSKLFFNFLPIFIGGGLVFAPTTATVVASG